MQEARTSGGRGIPRLDTPARLALATPAGNDLEPVRRLLVGAGFALEGEGRGDGMPVLVDEFGPDDLEALPEWLTRTDDAHLLFLFNAPIPLMARNMSRGLAPAEALGRWQVAADQVLAITRRHRRQMTLMPLEGALSNPSRFIDVLGERLGVRPGRVDQDLAPEPAPGALYRMMAENAVWQSIQARQIAAELEANSVPLPASPEISIPTVDEVYREFSQTIERARERKESYKAELQKARERLANWQQETTQEKSRLRKVEEENQLLLQQLHQVQEELESTFQKMQELQQSLGKEKSAPPQDDEATPKDEARIRDLEEENELLLQQLHHVQEELESYFLSGTDARQELEEARATIEALCNSKSWKITRPLRWFLEKFMGAEKAVR